MNDDPLLYREYSPNAAWVRLLLWGSLTAGAVAMLREPGLTPFLRPVSALGMLGFGLGLERFVLGLTIEVRRSELRFGLGNASLIRSSVTYDRISRVESVRYRPLREFGGWGMRGLGQRRAWTAAGDQAVVLHLVDGGEIYLGSEYPRRLEERIRAAMQVGRTMA
jgi:hypothetical protein